MDIEVGPITLVRRQNFDRVTLCLMSDHSLSERHYSKQGDLLTQTSTPASNKNVTYFEEARLSLEPRIHDLLGQKYEEQALIIAPPPKAPAVKNTASLKPSAAKVSMAPKKWTAKQAMVATSPASPSPVHTKPAEEEKKMASPVVVGVRRKAKEAAKA